MNEILALQEDHDLVLEDHFHFQYARVAFAVGRTAIAIASLNEYLVTAGRGAEFYRQALQLLDSAEVQVREEERAARWPPGGVFRDCEVCPEMVALPGGVALGRYEVTVREYRAFASATGGGAGGGCETLENDDGSWQNPGFAQTGCAGQQEHRIPCRPTQSGTARLPVLSREATEIPRGAPERASLAPTVPTPPACPTWSGTCPSERGTAGRRLRPPRDPGRWRQYDNRPRCGYWGLDHLSPSKAVMTRSLRRSL